MKPFDLEAAKRGDPIQTRGGVPVKFIAHIPEANEIDRVVVYYDGRVRTRFENGKFSKGAETATADLVMAPKRTKYWANVYRFRGELRLGNMHSSAELAERSGEGYTVVKILSFEIEE